ncbi:MAG: hypothetical protein IJT83_12155, partial [Victivallales bacterium]|nr:hypothetical protein [Victivallales bacterium]
MIDRRLKPATQNRHYALPYSRHHSAQCPCCPSAQRTKLPFSAAPRRHSRRPDSALLRHRTPGVIRRSTSGVIPVVLTAPSFGIAPQALFSAAPRRHSRCPDSSLLRHRTPGVIQRSTPGVIPVVLTARSFGIAPQASFSAAPQASFP